MPRADKPELTHGEVVTPIAVPAWTIGVSLAVGEAIAHVENGNCEAAKQSLGKVASQLELMSSLVFCSEIPPKELMP